MIKALACKPVRRMLSAVFKEIDTCVQQPGNAAAIHGRELVDASSTST
jgi:hypothetical protein